MRLFGIFLFAILLLGPAAYAEDSAFVRVQKKQELNCGVYVLGSIFSYDRNGKPAGFTTALFDEVSKRAGVKVKYTEISGFATMFEDLSSGRLDMICAPLLFVPSTVMKALPGSRIATDPIDIYTGTANDFSSVKSLKQFDDPKYRFVGMDGELGGVYVPKMFPKANLVLLPQGAQASDMFMNIQTKKADFVVLSNIGAKAYAADNPGKLEKVSREPLVIASVRLFYPPREETLRANIEAVLDDMRQDGTLDRILKKYDLTE